MWTEKASAHRPELVQMFDVAFSRRICCSRVESVSTKPRLPSASTVSPASRPGICRTCFSRQCEQADIGPAELQADADRLAFADDDVRAHLARRLDQPERDRLGHHRDQQRARGMRRLGNRRQVGDPAENVGILDDDALVSPSIAAISRSASVSAVSSGSEVCSLSLGELRHGLATLT